MAQQPHTGSVRDLFDFMQKNQQYSVADPSREERFPFIPLNVIKDYLEQDHETRLEVILDDIYFPHPRPSIDPSLILNNFVGVFCALLEAEWVTAIEYFVERDYNDYRFPFDPQNQPPGLPPDSDGRGHYKRFCETQWKFCAPEFQHNLNRHFEDKHRLPIVSKEMLSSKGGSATLYVIKIHGSYNKLRSKLSGAVRYFSCPTYQLLNLLT
jgi:hypothetical protein